MKWLRYVGFKRHVVVLSVLIMMFLVSLQGLVAVHRIEAQNRKLVDQTLPLFEVIQSVRHRLNEQEKLFHQYYLNGQMGSFTSLVGSLSRQNQRDLNQISTVLGTLPVLEKIDTSLIKLNTIAENFDKAMQTPTDWDKARDVLADFTPVASKIGQHSFDLLTLVNTSVKDNADETLAETENALLWSGSMIFVLFITAVILLQINRSLNLALVEQRRLSGFPEHNPDPVLALNESGDIIYANPGAKNLVRNGVQPSPLHRLIPVDFDQLMAKAKMHDGVAKKQHELFGKTYSVELHWLGELTEYHLYLSDISEQKRAQERLQYMAFHNSLTGLPNRQALEQAFLHQGYEYLLLFEVDDYQHIITSSGHATAESTITAFVRGLEAFLDKQKKQLFQIETNLFVFLANSSSQATLLIERLKLQSTQTLNINGRHFYISVSVGGKRTSGQNNNLFEELRKADSALRAVIQQGGNAFREFDDQLDAQYLRRTELMNDLRHAVSREELFVNLQPIYWSADGGMVAAEALLRWHRRKQEWVSPVEFIPIAEYAGLIVMLSEWLIEEVFSIARDWKRLRTDDLNIAINISAVHWGNDDLPDYLSNKLREFGLDASMFTLELTEQAALQSLDKSVITMLELREMGFKLAIDDFGTGFSSLNYLHRLPVDKLKIDKSFIHELEAGGKNAAIVKSLVELAHQLGMQVVAEGVENTVQKETLSNWGCDFLQGYLFAKPLPIEVFLKHH